MNRNQLDQLRQHDHSRRGDRRRLGWVAAGVVLSAVASAWMAAPAPARADATATSAVTPALFRGADLAMGEQLLRQHRCAECHARRVSGDGSAIYNPAGRINTPAALRGMVDYCSTELSLQLFPEEVTAVAAVLNRDHYRFQRP